MPILKDGRLGGARLVRVALAGFGRLVLRILAVAFARGALGRKLIAQGGELFKSHESFASVEEAAWQAAMPFL